jgi:RNA polymerase sigma factor (sigma-70 family)
MSRVPTAPEAVPSADDAHFAAILRALVEGDEHAIAWVFMRMQPRLLRLLRSQEPRAADDIAAEVWLAGARGVAAFDGSWADFRAWCFGIARRRLADHRRTAVRRRTEPVDTSELDGRTSEDVTEREALDNLTGEQAAMLIESVLRGEQAEVVLLRVLGDLDVDQVAAIMGRSANWVRVTQHRALRKLARRAGSKIAVIR